VEQLLGIQVVYKERIFQDAQKGRSARPQANRNRKRTLKGYVEDFDEPRTKLADFFSILSSFGFAVIKMPMLPVKPGMTKFVGQDVASSGHGQALTKINSFCVVVPDTVGIRVPTVHVGI
jgi:hypothetical protein